MFNFQVNTSGQFVGLAEMVGPVDFNKNVEYWQQDKWNGCFPVKWHIVKDVPNSLLKHITLDNNENKPVTNSRDTQEVILLEKMFCFVLCSLFFCGCFLSQILCGSVQVKMEPGLRLIKIFKEHSSKTCILDDFGFYETRQKTIQEKKAKQQQFQKQVRQLDHFLLKKFVLWSFLSTFHIVLSLVFYLEIGTLICFLECEIRCGKESQLMRRRKWQMGS